MSRARAGGACVSDACFLGAFVGEGGHHQWGAQAACVLQTRGNFAPNPAGPPPGPCVGGAMGLKSAQTPGRGASKGGQSRIVGLTREKWANGACWRTRPPLGL